MQDVVAGLPGSDFAATRSQRLRSVALTDDARSLLAGAATASDQAILAEAYDSTLQQQQISRAEATAVASDVVETAFLPMHKASMPGATVRVCYCKCTLRVVHTGTHTVCGLHRPRMVLQLPDRLEIHNSGQALQSRSHSLPERSARFAQL